MLFHVTGHFVEEDGLFYAVSDDGRFVTHGATKAQALRRMDDLLEGYGKVAVKHEFDPNVGPTPSANLETWNKELVPA